MKIRSKFVSAMLLATGASIALSCGAAQAADFTTGEGFAETCRDMKNIDNPEQLHTDDMRVAFAICSDTGLTQQIVTWVTQSMKRYETGHTANEIVIGEIFKEIDYARSRLAESRGVLEKINLGTNKTLRLVPAQWAMDLNGDGKIDIWEKYFFAIPKRGKSVFKPGLPSNVPDYYDNEYQLDAAIKVDQSDILWALSYHYFIEGLLANVRAFDLSPKNEIYLARPELLRQAHQLIGQGINTSEKMRQSILAETGNDEEWIGNPAQTSSVFPIALNVQDFATWGNILAEWKALWQGKHLLPVTRGGGLLGALNLCAPGTGLDIKKAYLQPPPNLTIFPLGENTKLFNAQCRKVDQSHPLSTLPDMIAHARDSDTGMQFLRYIYWTN